MARPPSSSTAALLDQLASGAPVAAGALVERLGVTRPVLQRLVEQAGAQVIRFGQTRGTHYVAASLTGAESWPLYRMGPEATLTELGTLFAARGDGFAFVPNGARPNLVRPVDGPAGYFPGLPWFLDDVRPQGFLGRSMAHRQGRTLGVPADLKSWQLRDNLIGIQHGGTSVGDLLLGHLAVDRALDELDNPTDLVTHDARLSVYARRAQSALEGEEIGSSPGGEQPKFTATVQSSNGRVATLVKFAFPGNGATGQRWSDLLACEHLALSALRNAGMPAAYSELLRDDMHTFLQVERFDRTPDVLGRRGFVSLLAVDAAFIGRGPRDWGLVGSELQRLRIVTRETAFHMACLYWFGRLIGNSDMHLGNVAFHLADEGPLPLCPAYDMLPMYLAPSSTGNIREAMPITVAAPDRAGQIPMIQWAAPVAIEFWQHVAESSVSSTIRDVARLNIEVVQRFATRFAA